MGSPRAPVPGPRCHTAAVLDETGVEGFIEDGEGHDQSGRARLIPPRVQGNGGLLVVLVARFVIGKEESRIHENPLRNSSDCRLVGPHRPIRPLFQG